MKLIKGYGISNTNVSINLNLGCYSKFLKNTDIKYQTTMRGKCDIVENDFLVAGPRLEKKFYILIIYI